jgi:hypothetical protein
MDEQAGLTAQEISSINAVAGVPDDPPVDTSQVAAQAVEAAVAGNTETTAEADETQAEPIIEAAKPKEPPKSRFDEQLAERTAKLIEADNAIRAKERNLEQARRELAPVMKLAEVAASAVDNGDYIAIMQALWPEKSVEELVHAIVDKYEGPKQLTQAEIEAIADRKAEARFKKFEEEKEKAAQDKKKQSQDTYNQEADKYIGFVDAEFRRDRDKYPLIVPGNSRLRLTREECLEVVEDIGRKTGAVPSPSELLAEIQARREKDFGSSGLTFARKPAKPPIPGTMAAAVTGSGVTNGAAERRSHSDVMDEEIANLRKLFA